MITYLCLNIGFMLFVIAGLLLGQRKPFVRLTKAWLVAIILLLVLTALFDSLLIYLDVFAYSPAKILGVHIGLAPIEDFAYPLLAVILVPALWKLFGKAKP